MRDLAPRFMTAPRYACPSCGHITVSLLDKTKSRRGKPGRCSSCGAEYFAVGLAVYLVYSIGMYVFFFAFLALSLYVGSVIPVGVFILAWPFLYLLYAASRRLSPSHR